MRRRLALVLATTLVALVAGALVASAATEDAPAGLDVRIEQLVLEDDGTTRMTVAVSGLPQGEEISLDRLEVVENGRPVEGLTLAAAEEIEEGAIVPAVVVAFDVSGSTQGEPIAAARPAAVELLAEVAASGGQVGAVSFGDQIQTLAPLSSDATAAIEAVNGLEAGGETSLYDGVSRAVRMLATHDGPRDVIVFSDGEDTVSTTGLDDVRALLAQTEVRVTSVLLQSGEVAVAPLEAMSSVNGGRLVTVEGTTGLGAAFEAIAGDLTNRLEVVWTVDAVPQPARTLNIVATYQASAGAVSDDELVASPRLASVSPPRDVQPPTPAVPLLAGEFGRLTAAASAGAAVLIMLLVILVSGGVRRRRDALDRRLEAYQASVGERGRDDRVTLSDRASTAFDVIPRPANLDTHIARAIEHGDWPMRVGEFLLLSIGLGILGLLIGAVLLASPIVAVLALVLGFAAPWMYLQISISRRRAAFAEQLPTVLQVIAGALRAGHALSTALDGTVDEVDEPARSELRRASVEARLGRPLDRALGGVAERMASEDLRWVIGAIEVQREVGGNLAEILGNVAETLRDRASVARHVKSLTAEGRLSAAVISVLPFGMFVLLSIMNPEYMSLLFERTLGRLMLAAGALLLVVGIVVLRRLVQPRY